MTFIVWSIQYQIRFYSLNTIRIKKRFRVNDKIRSATVQLVDEKKKGLVEVSLEEALEKAKKAGLDLVEVDSTSEPPVCKIMDYGKRLYKMKKDEKRAKKAQKSLPIKEIRLKVGTGDHDLGVKEKKAKQFLEKGHKLRLTLMMRGREMAHMDLAYEKIKMFSERLAEFGTVEEDTKRHGNRLLLILSPTKK